MYLSYFFIIIKTFYVFKISFLEVLELVKSRRVFLKEGFAYVTMADFGAVLTHAFRTRLSKGLSVDRIFI
jgi:DNA primase large subunit